MRPNQLTRFARITQVAGLVLFTWATFFSFISPASAQKKMQVKLRVKYDRKESKETARNNGNIVELRPNVPQRIYLYAENENPLLLRGVTAKLMQVNTDGSTALVKQVKLDGPDGFQSKEWLPISFGEPKKEAKADEKAELALPGPPFEFQVWFEDAAGDYEVQKEMLTVRIKAPWEYVKEVDSGYDKDSKTVSVSVTRAAEIRGPFCIIKLEMDPDLNPGLIPVKTTGAYKQILIPGVERTAELKAESLKFEGTAPKYGRISLTVDGYPRAFVFSTSYADEPLNLLKLEQPRIRILAPRYGIPGQKLPVVLEVDTEELDFIPRKSVDEPRPKPTVVQVDFDIDGDGKNYFTLKKLKGHRDQRVTYNPEAGGGAILLTNTLKDWQIELDTAELYGRKNLRVQFLKDGQPVPLANEPNELKPIGLFEEGNATSPYAPMFLDASAATIQEVIATVTLDATKPDVKLAFELENKTTHRKGAPLTIKALVKDVPPISPIKEVMFYVGKPDPKGKFADDALKAPGKQVAGKPSIYEAELPIVTTMAGVFFVSVQATNQAGLSEIKTIRLILVDPPPGANNGNGVAGAKVTGSVSVGGLAQADVPVALTDPKKGDIKGFTKTDKTGKFVFEKVEPGTYQITATNAALKLKGQTLVQVPKGQKLVEGVKIMMTR